MHYVFISQIVLWTVQAVYYTFVVFKIITYSVDSCPFGLFGVGRFFQFTLSHRKKKSSTAGWISAVKSSVAVTQLRARSSWSDALSLVIDGSNLSHSPQHRHSISVGIFPHIHTTSSCWLSSSRPRAVERPLFPLIFCKLLYIGMVLAHTKSAMFIAIHVL